MKSNARKWLGLIIAILCYYIVHEGTHAIAALFMGSYQRIKFMFPGMQIVVNKDAMSDLQLAVFCIAGPLATLLLGYALVLITKRILKSNNKVIKAAFYYMTLGMLIIDPIYLSVLCGFFGGGDMNGIILFGIPEVVARSAFGVIGAINVFVFVKYIYLAYKADFQKTDSQRSPHSSLSR